MINATSLEKHETIEVRLHQGTTDETKIVEWAKLLMNIMDSRAFSEEGCEYKLEQFINYCNVNKDYFFQRLKKFNPSLVPLETNIVELRHEDGEEQCESSAP